MAKKKPYRPKAFEAIGEKFRGINGMTADTSCNIYESMLQSEAFRSLTNKQQVLYVYIKAQYYGKRKPGKDYPLDDRMQDESIFYFNWNLARRYGLYGSKSSSNFYKDMAILEERGFIEHVARGTDSNILNRKSIYRYSWKWKEWKDSRAKDSEEEAKDSS